MCGLIFTKRFDGKSAVKMTIRRFHEQKERGREGFGYLTLQGGEIKKFLRTATEETILDDLAKQKADEVLFHHRNPTSTENVWECAHPIKVSRSKFDFYVAHNGVISNTEDLKKNHEKEGIKYSTLLRGYWVSEEGNIRNGETKWNDSESLAIELAKSLEEREESIAEVRGSIAFLALKVDRETNKAVKLYWGRNYMSPLKSFKSDDFLILTSTGKGADVTPHRLFSFDYLTGEIKDKPFTVGTATYNYTGEYAGGYGRYYDREDYRGGIDKPVDIEFDEPHRTAGFTKPLPLIGAAKTDQAAYDLEKWMDDASDLDNALASRAKATDPTMIDYLDTEIAELEASIKAFNEKYPSLAGKPV